MICPFCGAPLPSHLDVCPACGRPLSGSLDTETAPASEVPPAAAAQTTVYPNPDEAPTHLGEFRILRRLGRGGMGAVYEAHQESMHRKVALKVLESGAEPSPDSVMRFEREAWIAGRLGHPNIVKVHGQGVDGQRRWISMELVQGGPLHDLVRDIAQHRAEWDGTKPGWRELHIKRMVRLFVQIADALVSVHAQGVVHRDIKPLNLLLDRDRDRLVLSDFGLARDPEETRMTRRGDFMGTIRYMSPEQLLAHRTGVDHRSDIWSLGVSLYEAVTLELPFKAPTEEGYIGAVSMKDPIPARAWIRVIPRDLETILMKCLERNPERRYQSAALLKDDLGRLLEDRPVLARRAGPFQRGARFVWRRRAMLGAAAAGIALTAFALVQIRKSAASREDLGRIRWTLERVAATGAAPSDVQPDWPRLEARLRSELSQSADSALANLAISAATSVGATVPAYGLLSNLPRLEFRFQRQIEAGFGLLNSVEVEGSWDQGEWRAVGTFIFCPHTAESPWRWRPYWEQFASDLDEFISSDQLTPGPHRLEMRLRLRSLPRSSFDLPPGYGAVFAGSLEDRYPEARNAVAVHEAKRNLGVYPITLYKEFPENFPYRISGREIVATAPDWFRLDRISILRGRVPPGTSTEARFAPEGEEPLSLDLRWVFFSQMIMDTKLGHPVFPRDLAENEVRDFILRLRLEGMFSPPTPISAQALLTVSGEEGAILQFPLCLSRGYYWIYPHIESRHGSPWSRVRRASADSTVNFRTIEYDVGGSILNFTENGKILHPATPASAFLPHPIKDGTYQGRLDLIPSRSLALATGRFESYLGAPLSIATVVVVKTIDGERIPDRPYP